MSVCRSCGAEIEWIVTKSGAKMPLDPEYVEWEEADPGTKLVTDQGTVYIVDHSKNYSSVRGRISHFATCDRPNDWRRR
jgi:hypothetical protein